MKPPEKRPAKDFQTSLLLDPKVKEKAQAAGAASGRSTSGELRYRIEQSFKDDEAFPTRHDPVIRALGAVLEQIQRHYGLRWFEDPEVGDLCRRKMVEVLDLFLPTIADPAIKHFIPQLGVEAWEMINARDLNKKVTDR